MKRARLVLLIFALSVAVFGLPAQSFVVCHGYSNCELNCEPKLEQCYNGTFHTECGGDITCCNNAMSSCFACCIWY
jgi:hypothetical protein